MTVYAKEKASFLREAIDSMLNQTIKPSEFILVCDGQLTKELNNTISNYSNNEIFKIIRLKSNQGSGPASAKGVLACNTEWIARLDSDDIALPNRIEKQFEQIKKNPKIDIIGTNVIEFLNENNKTVEHKVILPSNDKEIRTYNARRCPFRTSAIMFKKNLILEAGNYRSFYRVEDYDAFTRMIERSTESSNIQEYLTRMRIDKNYFKRRGGLKLARSIIRLKNEMLRRRQSSVKDWVVSVPPQIIVCLMPNFARDLVYRKMLRS